MPSVINPGNTYSETRAGNFIRAIKSFPDRVYVPNSGSNSVDVIDPHTFQIVNSLRRWTPPAAHHAFVGPEDALGVERSW
jgi:DNA-binding beta-propeller fold protein YncE